MRFLGDIPIAGATLRHLEQQGHDAISVRDRLVPTAPDAEILRLAVAERRVILCFDLDFGTLVALSGERLPSVVTFRTRRRKAAFINQRLDDVLPQIVEDLAKGVLATVEDRRVRIRRLPVGK